MTHALIIKQNNGIGRELSKQLTALGFDSFDHVWTEDDAMAIADMRHPDLVLVGDKLESGDAMQAARRISEKHDVPILLAAADSLRARQRMTDGAVLNGGFVFSKIPDAIESAQKLSPLS